MPSNLDLLETLHTQERACAPDLLERPRPMALTRDNQPPTAVLEPDPLRSTGPWIALRTSDAPVTLFDATGRRDGGWGFSNALERHWVEGAFANSALTSRVGSDAYALDAWQALTDQVRAMVGDQWQITFAPTGQEAVFRAAHLLNAQPTSIIHCAAIDAFPLHVEPGASPPCGFLEALVAGTAAEFNTEDDPLFEADIHSLYRIHTELQKGTIGGCTVAPYHAQGHASARYLQGLRALTLHHNAWLLVDERSAPCAPTLSWSLGLFDPGALPDALVFQDPGGIGLCVGPTVDPEPLAVEAASLRRACLRLSMVAARSPLSRERFLHLAARFPEQLRSPKAHGSTLSFELPTSERRKRFCYDLFTQGVLAKSLGERAVAIHIPPACTEAQRDVVFAALEATCAESSRKASVRKKPRADYEIRVRFADTSEADTLVADIRALEARIFEPARRDSVKTLRAGFIDPAGSAVVAEAKRSDGTWQLVGYAVGAPLEWEYAQRLDGCNEDAMLHHNNTLYSIAISVDPEFQGFGLGRRLKVEQIRHLRTMMNDDGSPRYRYVTGRNRVGLTPAMTRINRALGGHTIKVYTHQYGEPEGRALYYRIPVRGICADPDFVRERGEGLDLSGGLCAPLSRPPSSLIEAEHCGELVGALLGGFEPSKACSAQAAEAIAWLRTLTPTLPGLQLAHSREGALEAAVRLLRVHRPGAQVGLGLRGGYVGHNGPSALKLSDPSKLQSAHSKATWPLLPHPAVDAAGFSEALEQAIAAAGGAGQILGLFVEMVQERSGHALTSTETELVEEVSRLHGIPLIVVETATAHYRSGSHPFAYQKWSLKPDVMVWWSGGQMAAVHTSERYVPVEAAHGETRSNGGELALVRAHHQLMALRKYDLEAATTAMDVAMLDAQRRGIAVKGDGLYRVLDAQSTIEELLPRLKARKMRVRQLITGELVIAPSLDVAVEVATQLSAVFNAL